MSIVVSDLRKFLRVGPGVLEKAKDLIKEEAQTLIKIFLNVALTNHFKDTRNTMRLFELFDLVAFISPFAIKRMSKAQFCTNPMMT
jgi:hypothetical protein